MSDSVHISDTAGDTAGDSLRAGDLVRISDDVYVSKTSEATYRLGHMLGASVLADGDVLILTGDLGTGKTQLTKGIASGLGSDRAVVSPTFTLMISYTDGRIPLFHFDFYRLERACELRDIGVFDVVGEEGVSVVEWGERFADDLGAERLDVVVERRADEITDMSAPIDASRETFRTFTLIPHGVRARQIISDLARVFEKAEGEN